MAKLNEKVIRFIIQWEAGTTAPSDDNDMKKLFERARKKGWSDDPHDLGGATLTGLTLGTYKTYCKAHGISEPTKDNLKNIPYETWYKILKEFYWDKIKGDLIDSQSVAFMLFDFMWASGSHAAKGIQSILGVTVDGVIGTKTLAVLNGKSSLPLFNSLLQYRLKFVDRIVQRNPSQAKWIKGWKARINAIKYED